MLLAAQLMVFFDGRQEKLKKEAGLCNRRRRLAIGKPRQQQQSSRDNGCK
jgi:hypothetical protein